VLRHPGRVVALGWCTAPAGRWRPGAAGRLLPACDAPRRAIA
jgi:hypothetical protein